MVDGISTRDETRAKLARMATDRTTQPAAHPTDRPQADDLPAVLAITEVAGLFEQIDPQRRQPFLELAQLLALYADRPQLAEEILVAVQRISIRGVSPERQLAESRKILEQWGPRSRQS